MSDNRLIELTDISMIWDRRPVLSDVNLSIERGDFMAITGPNGGGKTTLLRIILRLLKPTGGSVRYFGNDGCMEVSNLHIGYLPQKNMIDSRFPITVREVISLGLVSPRAGDAAQRLDDTARLVGLESHLNASLGSLSGGQMQRALLARAIISRPEVLVLDEPLSYVDKQFEHRIYDIVSQLARTTTIILVSHEMSTIASMANRHVIVDHTTRVCHSHNHFIHYDCCDSDHSHHSD